MYHRGFSIVLIILGTIVMLLATIRYFRMSKSARENSIVSDDKDYARIRTLKSVFHIIFILCFVFFSIYTLFKPSELSIMLISILILGATFVLLDVEIQSKLLGALFNKNTELERSHSEVEKRNEDLYLEIQSGWEELWKRDRLLNSVNSIATILLTSNMEDFDKDLNNCIERLSRAINVDRGYVWRNHDEDGKLTCSLIASWWSDEFPDDPKYLNSFAYEDAFFDWESFSNNDFSDCFSGTTDSEVNTHMDIESLTDKNVKSFLIVPINVNDSFWGIIAFDDCQNYRSFSDDEKDLLTSVSLLIGNAVVRNELTNNLVIAREEALASTTAKSNFLANMSHEIRTPINAVTGMATIARATDDIDKIKDCLSKIDAASRQLLGLINDILDMSKIEAQKFDLSNIPFSIEELINNVKSIVGIRALEKNQNLTLTIENELPPVVIGDEMRLSQIMINLLSNAVKFTPEGGEIDLIVRTIMNDDMFDRYEIEVKDTGIGITDEQMPKLFNAFEQADGSTTRRFGGTGLGLTISKNLAALMKGDISVESEPDVGSTFTAVVYLERGNENTRINRTIIKDTNYDFSKYTILLAEDVEINKEIIVELLGDSGVTVDCVDNGQEAVDAFKENPDKYDLILMDIQMPVLDGYSATEKIREMDTDEAKNIPIIAMTANAFNEDIIRAKEAGMNAHVAKPIDIDLLTSTMSEYLQTNDERGV